MSNIAIRVENVAKHYRIGHRKTKGNFREALVGSLTAPFRRAANILRGNASGAADLTETLWALNDVSFEVKQGEIVGLIGRNGAGKSTLLKVLTRITEPTRGAIDIYGRVGSLLEVGTGFHPELSGRDNVFLNGAILGMKRTEIQRKFDEIVAFAEVERFIDTPVKHYSSGMYLRLAFAVASHLEPEILLLDEVLAVGDSAFQKKCLNKMQDIGAQGRTVVFVSHDISAVTRLCSRCILLNNGTVKADGPAHEVASIYLTSGLGTSAAREWPILEQAPGDDVARLRAVRVKDETGQLTDTVDIHKPVGIEMEFEVYKPGYVMWPHFTLHNEQGVFVFAAYDLEPSWRGKIRQPGRYISTGWIPGNLLSEGIMTVGPAMTAVQEDVIDRLFFYERDAVAFQVVDSMSGEGARGDYVGKIPGVVRPLLKWTSTYKPHEYVNGHHSKQAELGGLS
jgi:lipopolysaccharide transport system ATP-binding protein